MGLKNTYQAKKRFTKTPVKSTGMWYQDGDVIVPSNQITMKGPQGQSDYFNSPILGVGMQSGETQIMQPGREYLFPNDNSVFETRMQNGGVMSSPKYNIYGGLITEYQNGGTFNTLLRTNPAGNVGYSDNTTFVNPQVFLNNKNRQALYAKQQKEEVAQKPIITTKDQVLTSNYDNRSYSDNTFVKPFVKTTVSPEKLVLINKKYEAPDLTNKFYTTVLDQSEKQTEEIYKDYSNSSKQKIIDLQNNLLSKGYDIGNTGADGIFGSKTKTAYKESLKDSSLDESVIGKYYNKYKTIGADPKVSNIQKKLANEGLLSMEDVDGKFGPVTKTALEKYNEIKNEKSGIVFSNVPAKINDTRCAAGMCKILESNSIPTQALGMKNVDAWNMFEKMNKTGNSQAIYNIYDNPVFKNAKNTSSLKSLTEKVKRNSVVTKDMFKTGDVVGIYYPASSHHKETLNSKTHNTHVGWVKEIKNGVPIIAHNIDGKIYEQPFNQLTTTWIQRPKQEVLMFSDAWKGEKIKYKPKEISDSEFNVQPLLENFETKIERKLNENEKKTVGNIIKRSHISANELANQLKSSVDKDWLEKTVFGIAGTESAAGLKAPRSKDDIGELRKLGYTVKGVKDEDISLGVGKVKYNQIDDFAKSYLGISKVKDLSDDKKNVDFITYNLIKGYELFKDYSEKFPELKLTDEDIKNMAVLAHNQGTSKLLNTGRSKSKTFLTPKQELQELRKLYNGTIKDVSSTNYKYFGAPGEFAFNLLEDPKETYISKVNRYTNEVYNSFDDDKKTMQNGGLFPVGPYDEMMAPKQGNYLLPDINRPYYIDDEGGRRSEYKMGINIDGKETLLPTVVGGRQLTDEQAEDQYMRTGLNMGKFNNVEDADYASRLRTARYNMFADPIRFNQNQFQVGGETSTEQNPTRMAPINISAKRRNQDYRTYQDNTINNNQIVPSEFRGKRYVQPTLSEYVEPSIGNRILNTLASPMTALSNNRTGSRNPYDYALDMVNPFSWIESGEKAVGSLTEGQYTDAALNALGALPAIGFADDAARFASKAGKYATTKTPLKNAYKINPKALKEAQETMLVRARPVGQNPYVNMAEQIRAKEAAGEPLKWYQKNLLNPQTNPQIAAREKYFGQWFADNPSDLDFYINPETRNFADDAQIEILKARMPKSEAAKYNVKNFEDAKSLSNLHDTEYILPKDMVQTLERFPVEDLGKLQDEYRQINTPHWLKGYKPIEVSMNKKKYGGLQQSYKKTKRFK